MRTLQCRHGILAAVPGLSGDLLSFVEQAIGLLLAPGGEALQLRQAELLFEQRDAFGQRGNVLLRLVDLR